jgi:hypothetical protein
LQDLGVTPFVELSLDDDEGLSTACELSSLRLVSREHLAEEVVKIRHPPVDRRVGLRRWFPVKLHDLEVRRSQRLTSPHAQGRQFVLGPIWLLVADRGLILIASKDAGRNGLAARRHFCQCVGCLVEPSWDVVKLEAVELVLQLMDLLAIHSHLGTEAARLFHDLVNDKS